jgi:DNA processing protein
MMTCNDCQRRAALIAALAPAISRLSFTRDGLLALLAASEDQLLRATKVKNPRAFLRTIAAPHLSEHVPTALCRHDPDYPEALAQTPAAPAVLYATCSTEALHELLAEPAVAIVGSRDYTPYARQISFELARDLARAGVTIISGLNIGLEVILHRNAIGAGGHTIAVMSGGPDIPFTGNHTALHTDVLARGAAVSEFPPGFFHHQGWTFIASQRIIAALARVLVIIEVAGRSCGMFTAQIATNLGAEVAIVPGRVTDPGGSRTFALLRDGAQPVGCAQDVIDLIDRVSTREIAA